MPVENPTFLTVETHEGRATLGGRRRLSGDFEEAAEIAEEIDGQVFALEPVEAVDIVPVPAVRHIRLADVPELAPIDTEPAARFTCPCGARDELAAGATDEQWQAWAEKNRTVHAACMVEVR